MDEPRLINLTIQVEEASLLNLVEDDAILVRADAIRAARLEDEDRVQSEVAHLTRTVKVNNPPKAS
jgi:hypothetical protein